MGEEGAGTGYRAAVGALATGQVVSWAALYYAFSSFVLPMHDALGWDKAVLMGAFTLGLGVWGAASYAVGAAIDKGYGRAVLAGGALLGGLGLLLWSQASVPWMLYAAWAINGVAMAMLLYDPVFSVVAKRWPARTTQGITTLTLVGGFASTLAFPAASALLAWLGWRGALAAIGAVLIGVVAPLHWWALRGAATASPRADLAFDAASGADSTLSQALRDARFWLLTLTFTLYAFAAAALWAHVMPAFAAKGFSEGEALAVVVWVGPAQVAGRFVYAWLGRGIALQRLGLAVLAGMPLALVVFALADAVATMIAFALLFGVSNGLSTIVRGGLVPQLFGRTSIGRISGAMNGIALSARAAAPLAAAWVLLVVEGYPQLMLLLAIAGGLAFIAFALALRRPR